MRLVSQGAQYAILTIIAISKHSNDVILAFKLSISLNCTVAYLSQILSKLKATGILNSQRGLNGGVYLPKPLEEVSIYDVVSAIDGEPFFSTCFMGIENCGHIEPCAFHTFWATRQEEIKKWLQTTSFAEAEGIMAQTWFDERLSFSGVSN